MNLSSQGAEGMSVKSSFQVIFLLAEISSHRNGHLHATGDHESSHVFFYTNKEPLLLCHILSHIILCV